MIWTDLPSCNNVQHDLSPMLSRGSLCLQGIHFSSDSHRGERPSLDVAWNRCYTKWTHEFGTSELKHTQINHTLGYSISICSSKHTHVSREDIQRQQELITWSKHLNKSGIQAIATCHGLMALPQILVHMGHFAGVCMDIHVKIRCIRTASAKKIETVTLFRFTWSFHFALYVSK